MNWQKEAALFLRQIKICCVIQWAGRRESGLFCGISVGNLESVACDLHSGEQSSAIFGNCYSWLSVNCAVTASTSFSSYISISPINQVSDHYKLSCFSVSGITWKWLCIVKSECDGYLLSHFSCSVSAGIYLPGQVWLLVAAVVGFVSVTKL